MRILYDSRQLIYKTPFGTLTPNQTCTLHIHIPVAVQAKVVSCILSYAGGAVAQQSPL